VSEALQFLRGTVSDQWESLDQVLREHANVELGHPHLAGTGLWHLRHMVEIFRIHAAAASNGDLAFSGDIPHDPGPLRDMLIAHIDEFLAWAGAQTPKRLTRAVYYGDQITFPQMLGVMMRHITWHAAAVHYWVKWKAAGAAGPTPIAPEIERSIDLA
jgi:hypothetical protein